MNNYDFVEKVGNTTFIVSVKSAEKSNTQHTEAIKKVISEEAMKLKSDD